MDNYKDLMASVNAVYASGKSRSLKFREKQLKQMLKMCEEKESEMAEALMMDLRKHKLEAILYEIEFLRNDLRNTLINLREWAKPEKPEKSFVNMLDEVVIYKEPYGVVLVMGAWNYPLQLTLAPVIAAIAAGNCVVIKPSEVAPATAKFMNETIPKYLDQECYHVVCGGVAETTELLKHRFDYIFYTGSTRVGQIIHTAATKNLTPVTLELGGKSPCYLDKSADIGIATKRILWGKLINAGQTCIAPDYLICSKDVQDQFIQEARKVLDEWYGKNSKDSPDLCRIINQSNFQRLVSLMKSGNVALGGQVDASQLFIEPTILTDVQPNSAIMNEEIFGPILPILNSETVNDAVKYINSRPSPLVLYLFTTNERDHETFLHSTRSGSVCINDTVMQYAVDSIPFGGIGASGMGAYHGKYSYDTFTHNKGCLKKNYNFIGENLGSSRYPPYTESKITFLSMLMKKRSGIPLKYFTHILVFALGIATAIVVAGLSKKRR